LIAIYAYYIAKNYYNKSQPSAATTRRASRPWQRGPNLGCLETNKYSYTSFGCLLIGQLEQMKGQGLLISCFMNEITPLRHDYLVGRLQQWCAYGLT